nr:unnamed protein product [Callosobruchus chinensis]
MRKENYAERVGAGAPVYLGAVKEYFATEVLELAGNAARDNTKTNIIPAGHKKRQKNEQISVWCDSFSWRAVTFTSLQRVMTQFMIILLSCKSKVCLKSLGTPP